MALKFVEKLSVKEKKIFYIMSVFVLLALFDRAFLGPVVEKVAELDTQIEQQKAEVLRDMKVLSYKDRIIAENELYSKYTVSNIKDDDVVNADFLSLVESVATETSVNLIKSNPVKVEKNDRYADYYASIDCSGSLESVISFMHTINSSKELLKIVHFSMAPKRGTSNEVNVSMSVVKMIMLPQV
ncbi:MAG: hypothetical protein ACI9F2_000100 [Lysobacterales bacterium]